MYRAERLGPSWESPAALPRRWLAVVFAVSAVYGIGVAVLSSNNVHQTWGIIAACGYALATAAALIPGRHPRRSGGRPPAPPDARPIASDRIGRAVSVDIALALAFCGGLIVPLCWLVARGLRQPEVMVVARSGATLIHHGTPYPGAAALAATADPNAYNPYLPVMSLFGVPRALADSPFTDPRIWFGLAFVIVFWLALRQAGVRDPARWTVLVTGCPVIAFTLATGGDDAPMVAFLCLGFACLFRPEPVKAGLALGIAATMKATAWPAIAIAIALLAAAHGRRAVARFTVPAVAVAAVCAGPFLAQYPKALIENTVEFPLGLARVVSAAASPLPGHLIAETGHAGHTIVVVVLALAGLAIAASLVFRPPRDVPHAMGLLAGAMTLMFLLAPSTRYGYFIYPLTLVIWLVAAMAGRRPLEAGLPPGPGEPLARSRVGP